MSKPNFYFSLGTLKALSAFDSHSGSCGGLDFTVDIIDLPVYLMNTCAGDAQTVRIYYRNETYSHTEDPKNLKGTVCGRFGAGVTDSRVDKVFEQIAVPLYKLCDRIRCFAQVSGLTGICGDLDPERSGILIYAENGEVKYRVAAGKERPEMKCVADDRSGLITCRPYADEKEPAAQSGASDGNIDAVTAAGLFFDDVFYIGNSEVGFDGTHHTVGTVRFNSEVRDRYPGIASRTDTIVPAVTKLVREIEADDSLIIKKSDFHPYLRALTWDQDITGATVFNLCAFHMLKIVGVTADSYQVSADANLIDGIPLAYAYIAEFIRALRDQNGMTGPFSVMISSFVSPDGALTKNIEIPVAGAAKPEAAVTVTVNAGEHPYAQSKVKNAFAESLAANEEIRKRQEDAARAKAEQERRAAEEAARIKAEEERRAAEEAARAKAEDEQRAAEEAAQAVSPVPDPVPQAHPLVDEVNKKHETIVSAYQSVIREQSNIKADAEEALKNIGALKLGEKKRLKDAIDKADSIIAVTNEKLDVENRNYNAVLVELDKRAKAGLI